MKEHSRPATAAANPSSASEALVKAKTCEEQFGLVWSSAPLNQTVAVLSEYRSAAEYVFACDFGYARSNDVETHLWNAHNRLNGRLRKQLSKVGHTYVVRQ